MNGWMDGLEVELVMEGIVADVVEFFSRWFVLYYLNVDLSLSLYVVGFFTSPL